MKQSANTDFKEQYYLSAINKYSICIKNAEKIKLNDDLSILYSNRALCFKNLV